MAPCQRFENPRKKKPAASWMSTIVGIVFHCTHTHTHKAGAEPLVHIFNTHTRWRGKEPPYHHLFNRRKNLCGTLKEGVPIAISLTLTTKKELLSTVLLVRCVTGSSNCRVCYSLFPFFFFFVFSKKKGRRDAVEKVNAVWLTRLLGNTGGIIRHSLIMWSKGGGGKNLREKRYPITYQTFFFFFVVITLLCIDHDVEESTWCGSFKFLYATTAAFWRSMKSSFFPA